jgi:hypothetical protein
MGEDESTEWPDDNADPFGDDESENNPSLEKDLESSEEAETSEEEPVEPGNNFETIGDTTEWKLPIRAAPLLEQFHDEKVTEYPLQQSVDGRKVTSLVIDDDLLRIIDSSFDDDGQRRLKVSLSMKREITGFKHQHNELMHKHQLLWLGLFILGVVFLLSANLTFNLIGTVFVVVGARYWVSMHLETHHLEFSNSGGSLSHTLHGYGTNRAFFRASMALLGSEMTGMLRNGILETEALDELHASLIAPAPSPPPIPIPMPVQLPQTNSEAQPQNNLPQQALVAPTQIPPPPTETPQPSQPIAVEDNPMAGPPIVSAPLPAALPPPPISGPAPLPLPKLLPPLGGRGGMPLPPPLGLPISPIPLDAPLPNAPQIAVTASPIEDTLSEKEQSELLNELS